jgi:uncharacterized protein with GYD domain
MRDWVKPYLLKKFTEGAYQHIKDEKHRQQSLEHRMKQLEVDNTVYYELVGCLKYDFGGGFGGDQDTFITLLGSVLADLPEEVFKKISEMKNVVYFFASFPGVEVKLLTVDENMKGERLKIVVFPHESMYMPFDAIKGEIAHELARIFWEHDPANDDYDKRKDEANEVAKKWGFEKEIEALRKYLEEGPSDLFSM